MLWPETWASENSPAIVGRTDGGGEKDWVHLLRGYCDKEFGEKQ